MLCTQLYFYDSKKEAGLVTCFTFPSKEELKKKWIQKIPCENLIISKHTVICVKHFKEEDIIRNDILPGKNGDPDIVIPRKSGCCSINISKSTKLSV